MSPQLPPSTSLGPEPAGCLTVTVWFKAGAELPAQPTGLDQPKEQAQDVLENWLPQGLPFCITEENDVGCPEGFELDTQGAFCVGKFFPGPDRNKADLPWDVGPPQLAGKNCEQSLTSPTQTRTNAQGVPAPAPIPAAMLLAISPAPAPMASPWLGTAGTVEVRSPGRYSSVLAPCVQ